MENYADMTYVTIGKILDFLKNPPIIFLFTLFTAAVYLSDPNGFLESWNDGNGALLALVPLLVLEVWSKSFDRIAKRAKLAYLTVILGGLFIFLSINTELRALLIDFATALGSDITIAEYSWVQAVVYFVSSAVVTLLSVISGKRIVLPAIYTFALTLFLVLDTFFPYNEIGILQYWVNPVLQLSASLINFLGLAQALST